MSDEPDDNRIDLAPEGDDHPPAEADRRRRMREPPPVRLVAVADARLSASAGLEPDLDAFYVGLLEFERGGMPPKPKNPISPWRGANRQLVLNDPAAGPAPPAAAKPAPLPPAEAEPRHDGGPVYISANFRIRFQIVEGLVTREILRPLGVEVESLALAETKLIAAGIDYARQRGINPGEESLLVYDPAGNGVELSETRLIP